MKVEEELSAWKVVWGYRKADRVAVELALVYLQVRAGDHVHQFSWLWVWMMGLEFEKTLGSEKKKDVYIDYLFLIVQINLLFDMSLEPWLISILLETKSRNKNFYVETKLWGSDDTVDWF